MNYQELVELLDTASAFDLFRIRAALDKMIDDPRRLMEVKVKLHLGQRVTYFDTSSNCVQEAIVEKIKQSRALVRDTSDGKGWDIPLAAINIRNSDVETGQRPKLGVNKNDLEVGDKVSFTDHSGIERFASVMRRNQKTVTVESDAGSWRVSYGLLNKVIEIED